MKFAKLKQEYICDLNDWNMQGNLGDAIQNIAVENLLRELDIEPQILINHDALAAYNGDETFLVMQGWYGICHNTFSADWSEKIKPIFLGFHLNESFNARDVFKGKNIQNKMQDFEPIGCRDRNTADFLKSLGLNAYFSGCMTLTYAARTTEPQNGKIFIVDVSDEVLDIIPDSIKQEADYSITHMYKFKNYPISEEEALDFENRARELLARYRNEAKLVITSRIHCAMPCIAMGIPIVFINNNFDDVRFDVLRGLIPIYSTENVGLINWIPKAIRFDGLKNAIKSNALYQIWYNANYYCNSCKKLPSHMLRLKFWTSLYNLKGFIYSKFLKYQASLVQNRRDRKLRQLILSKKIVFWGASLFLKEYLTTHKIKNTNILCVIDKNVDLQGTNIGKYKIFAPEKLAELKPDVVICSIRNNHECIYPIVKQYLQENYPEIEILQDIFE